jgi:hypothetical protein
MVSTTNQPYAFVNDSPLNSEDPLGLVPSSGTHETNAQVAAAARAYAKSQSAAASNVAAAKAKATAQAAATTYEKQIVMAQNNIESMPTKIRVPANANTSNLGTYVEVSSGVVGASGLATAGKLIAQNYAVSSAAEETELVDLVEEVSFLFL